MSVTYGIIIEKEKQLGLNETVKWLQKQSSDSEGVNETTLRSSVQSVINKHKQLLKSKSRKDEHTKLSKFTEEIYAFPKPKSDSRKRKSDPLSESSFELESQKYKTIALDLAEELHEKTVQVNQLKGEAKKNKKKTSPIEKLKKTESSIKTKQLYNIIFATEGPSETC